MTSLEVRSPDSWADLRGRRSWSAVGECPWLTSADHRAPWRVARAWHALGISALWFYASGRPASSRADLCPPL